MAWTTPASASVVDVNPDGNPAEPRFGGRSLGLTVHPNNSGIVYVASEKGGFFVSTDGGTNWSHIDEISVDRARDILINPQDPGVIIASGRNDRRLTNQGGIWRSGDGGASWQKPAGSNPGCSTQASTWGIAIPNNPGFDQNVFVATDCGIAVSADFGVTWNHVDPCAAADAAFCAGTGTYFDVEARVVGGSVQLDVCGNEGYFRSPDGGVTWSAPDPASPARAVSGGSFNPCNVATAPNNANTVYLANYSGTSGGFCTSRLMENASAGAPGSWVNMNVSNNNCRDPWVVTHPHLGGNANRYETYFGTSQRVRRQTCDITNSPRCAAGAGNWLQADTGAHSDPSDIAFDSSVLNGCPIVLSTDGGISTSSDCGASWQDGNRGHHALDVVTFAGTVQGGGQTDLYAGTQDNGIYVTENNAATWTRPVGADGYNVLADRTPPARIFYRRCFGCNDFIADPGLAAAGGFSDPPGTIPTFARAAQFGSERYVFLTNDGGSPAQWTAWVTIDEGANWSQFGPSPLPGNPSEIRASGSGANLTFYLRTAGQIFRLSGALDNTATLTPASTGLSAPTGAWNVDPVDPLRLYAADNTSQMKFSVNGGISWSPDPELTQKITNDGEFQFWPFRLDFDPDSDAILVSTRTAGIVASVNNGDTWSRLADTEQIPRGRGFFFDPDNDDVYVASSGRGIWRLTLPDAMIQVPGNLDLGDTCVGDSSTGTLEVCNTGLDDLVIQPIISSNPRVSVTTPSSGYPVTISHDFCFPFQVSFDPSSTGPQSATLNISSNDVENPETEAMVSGEGTEQDVRVTGSTDFGVGSVWRPGEKTVSVCNSGDCDLRVFGEAVSCADFTVVSSPFPATVSPDSCLDLVVAFTPVLPGRKSCDLTVTTDDPDTPVVVRTLTGRTPPSISLHAGLVDPHGALGGVARQGSTLNAGFVCPWAPRWAWDLRLGRSSFDGRAGFPDTDMWSLSANARFTVNPAASVQLLLNGGLGVYHPDPGDFDAGGNLGLGLGVPVFKRFVFEATYNHHLIFTASPNLEYGQGQLGFRVFF